MPRTFCMFLRGISVRLEQVPVSSTPRADVTGVTQAIAATDRPRAGPRPVEAHVRPDHGAPLGLLGIEFAGCCERRLQQTSNMSATSTPDTPLDSPQSESLIRRSWHAMTENLHPFSPAALAKLPRLSRPARYTREDHIPDAQADADGNRPTVADYHAINSLPPSVRVPRKIATPIRVEGKVWFANERSEFRREITSNLVSNRHLSMDLLVEHGRTSRYPLPSAL